MTFFEMAKRRSSCKENLKKPTVDDNHRPKTPTYTISELESELFYWVKWTYHYPGLGPFLVYVEHLLHDGRNHQARAKAILDAEAEKYGLRPIACEKDVAKLERARAPFATSTMAEEHLRRIVLQTWESPGWKEEGKYGP